MKQALYIEGTRQGYTPSQIGKTMTIGELIELLCEYDEDTEVFIQNDDGYTFGEVSCNTITWGSYDEDGDRYYLGR